MTERSTGIKLARCSSAQMWRRFILDIHDDVKTPLDILGLLGTTSVIRMLARAAPTASPAGNGGYIFFFKDSSWWKITPEEDRVFGRRKEFDDEDTLDG